MYSVARFHTSSPLADCAPSSSRAACSRSSRLGRVRLTHLHGGHFQEQPHFLRVRRQAFFQIPPRALQVARLQLQVGGGQKHFHLIRRDLRGGFHVPNRVGEKADFAQIAAAGQQRRGGVRAGGHHVFQHVFGLRVVRHAVGGRIVLAVGVLNGQGAARRSSDARRTYVSTRWGPSLIAFS